MSSINPFPPSTEKTSTVACVERKTKKNEEDNSSPREENHSDAAKRDLEFQASIKQHQVQRLSNDILSSSCAFSLPTSENIDAFSDKVYIGSFQRKPQAVNQLALSEFIDDKSINRRLNEYSFEGKKEDLEKAKAHLKILAQYDCETLTPTQKITYKVLQWQLQHEADGEKFLHHEYLVTHTHGVFCDLVATFTRLHPIETIADFENYKTRLQDIPKQIAQVKSILISQHKNGIKLPCFSLSKSMSMINEYIKPLGNNHPLYIYCEKRIDVLPLVEKASLDWLKHIINCQVIPAFEDLKQCLHQLQLFTDTNHGLCKLPDGKEYYAYCLQRHTTTKLSAEEIHKLGIQEAARIQKEMRDVLEVVGIKDSTKNVGMLLGLFEKNKRPFLQKGAKKENNVIESFRMTLNKSRHLYKLQMERKKVPLMRKKGEFRAYSDGWELFSEKIADEKGVYKNICDKMDYLQFELLSAVRLIVDTGVHAMGWPIEYAIDYMQNKTGFKRQSVIAEVENIFVNPGQACACKVGQLKILEWRKKAMEALGEKFSLARFCNTIQNVGGVPLVVLEEIVDDHILSLSKNSA